MKFFWRMNRLANSGGFVCLNDSLHESLQDHPNVVILYVAMVIFVMIFLKAVTRPQLVRNSGNTRNGES